MGTKNHKRHKKLAKSILCFVVALSFFATLAQIAGASTDAMPCCAGKAAGHCDSGIAAKKVPPPSEPMCGRDNSALDDDGITIVAEPAHHSLSQNAETTSHAAESTSVKKPCQMECGTCASASSRQQKRERAIAESKARHASPVNSVSHLEDLPLVFTSNDDWPRINPRGPPRQVIL